MTWNRSDSRIADLEDENRSLRNQIADLEDTLKAERQSYREEYEQRRNAFKEEWESAQMRADTWQDGFERGIARHQYERDCCINWLAADPNNEEAKEMVEWWSARIQMLEAARDYYFEFSAEAQVEIATHEARIAELKAQVRERVANFVDNSFRRETDGGLPKAMRDDNPSWLVDW